MFQKIKKIIIGKYPYILTVFLFFAVLILCLFLTKERAKGPDNAGVTEETVFNETLSEAVSASDGKEDPKENEILQVPADSGTGSDIVKGSDPVQETVTEVTATPVPMPEIAATPVPTPEVTATPVPTPEVTATPVPTPEITATPVPTPEVTATPVPTPEVTATPVPTPEVAATSVPTPEVTATPVPTPEVTATPVPTPEITATPTPAPEVHEHSWIFDSYYQEPSCSNGGLVNEICAHCGQTQVTASQPTGRHIYVVETVGDCCSEEVRVCRDCNHRETGEKDMTNHIDEEEGFCYGCNQKTG